MTDTYETSTFPGQKIPRDRLDGTGDSPVLRAAQLGTEHGTRAAEAWLIRNHPNGLTGLARAVVLSLMRNPSGLVSGEPLPEPDLTDTAVAYALRYFAEMDDFTSPRYQDLKDAYKTVFRAAVEATVQARCEEVTR